jgi:F0F1-type ATP synthase assembly protein I
MVYSWVVRVAEGACMKNRDKNNPDEGLWAALGAGLAVPGQVLAYILGGAGLGLLAGHFIDAALGSSPIATFLGLLLGLALGIYGVVRLVTSLK